MAKTPNLKISLRKPDPRERLNELICAFDKLYEAALPHYKISGELNEAISEVEYCANDIIML